MVVHLTHLQDTFYIPSYSAVVMLMQVLWYHIEHSSHMTAARDQPTCNSHQPQGYTDWLHMAGPGFVSMSPHAKSTNSNVVAGCLTVNSDFLGLDMPRYLPGLPVLLHSVNSECL